MTTEWILAVSVFVLLDIGLFFIVVQVLAAFAEGMPLPGNEEGVRARVYAVLLQGRIGNLKRGVLEVSDRRVVFGEADKEWIRLDTAELLTVRYRPARVRSWSATVELKTSNKKFLFEISTGTKRDSTLLGPHANKQLELVRTVLPERP